MMKSYFMMKSADLEVLAIEALQNLLERNPKIKIDEIGPPPPSSTDRSVDIVASIRAFNHRYKVICEVKSNGEPRHAHNAALQLRDAIAHMKTDALPVLIAPFLSEKSREVCSEYGINYLDLHGNALFQAPGILIDVSVPGRPVSEKRVLKSLFSPKAAEILHTLLCDPKRAWRVAELAGATQSSLGQVSNVRKLLLERKWAKVGNDGMVLSDPDSLLDAWRDVYRRPFGYSTKIYTHLHGFAFEKAAKKIFLTLGPDESVAFASFSAAQLLAPYARAATYYFYADKKGVARIEDVLQASNVNKGENVEVLVLKDQGLLANTVEPVPNVICTNPVQTYLDLWISGGRGKEAAEHLRREVLTWQ